MRSPEVANTTVLPPTRPPLQKRKLLIYTPATEPMVFPARSHNNLLGLTIARPTDRLKRIAWSLHPLPLAIPN